MDKSINRTVAVGAVKLYPPYADYDAL